MEDLASLSLTDAAGTQADSLARPLDVTPMLPSQALTSRVCKTNIRRFISGLSYLFCRTFRKAARMNFSPLCFN
jgi:hypothetical protein